MAYEITVPRLGWSMEEGTLVRWLKQDGHFVRAGEMLFELESEKATQEIEALDSGILRIPPEAPQPGSVVQVGAVLAYLVAEGEEPPAYRQSSAAAMPRESAPSAVEHDACVESQPPPSSKRAAEFHATPAARRMARELGVDLASIGSGPISGRITSGDLRALAAQKAAPPATSRVIASPRARRVASQMGIDWRKLAGTGRGGRIRECDVRQAARVRSGNQSNGSQIGQALSGRRRTIAERMLASHQQTAPVTLTSRADATNLVNLRRQFQSAGQAVIPSFTDIIAKLTAVALPRHLLLAARLEDGRLVMPERIDIGIAVDTEAGLLVPVVRDVPALSLVEVARHSRALAEQARAGKLTAAEMQGGVFTISNLGTLGIDAFTPIIQLPEVAILGLGAIRREAVVLGEQIVARDQITLSLTFDHRVLDGAPAARFLQEVCQAIEQPSAWLLGCNDAGR